MQRKVQNPNRKQSAQTATRIEEIKRVWRAGMSASQLAAVVSFRASRNTIIGMFTRHADRLAPCFLPHGHTKGGRGKGKQPPKTPELPEPVAKRAQKLFGPPENDKPQVPNNTAVERVRNADGTLPVGDEITEIIKNKRDLDRLSTAIYLMQLTDTRCKWPVGHDGNAALFCGASKTAGTHPYCSHHAGRSRNNTISYRLTSDRGNNKQLSRA